MDRIYQVLADLLSNAMKYSLEGGVVTIGQGQQGTAVCVWIADEGMGMSPELVRDWMMPGLTGPEVAQALRDKCS